MVPSGTTPNAFSSASTSGIASNAWASVVVVAGASVVLGVIGSPVSGSTMVVVLAGIVVTPVLTVYSMVIGIAGGFFVMMMLGFPLATLLKQLAGSLTSQDVVAGLIKSFFFGAVVAGVGCMRGLQTGAGASAVGDSTTRSVVTSIFLIVVLDAIFAVVYYQLKF